jgi:flagellar motor protein MotB
MARKKREKKAPEGAPGWMVTYSDIVTLLLTFFVMLLAQAKMTRSEVEKFHDSIRQNPSGFKSEPTDEITTTSQKIFTAAQNWQEQLKKRGGASAVGLQGYEVLIRKRRRGVEISIGGDNVFDMASYSVRDDVAADLRDLAELLAPYPNVVEVTGYTMETSRDALLEIVDDTRPFEIELDPLTEKQAEEIEQPNWYQLGFLRARTVADVLEGDSQNDWIVDPRRIRLNSRGPWDPLWSTATANHLNRRVTILIIEEMP